MDKYVADFETTTDPEDCRVWAWAILGIDNDFQEIGNNIYTFMQTIKKLAPATIYFHNLAFDGEFILYYLLTHNYSHVTKFPDAKKQQFTSLINDKTVVYSITIPYIDKASGKTHNITFLDSFKLIPKSVEEIADKFKLPVKKLKLDYKAERKEGHILTEHEKEYLLADVTIMKLALKIFFDLRLEKMTIGSNAMHFYKNQIGKRKFNYWFPEPKYDADIRQAYKGGWTYLMDGYKDVDIGKGIVLDVNSLYPSRMKQCPMPYGEGKFFKGKYKLDADYPLYIQMFTCSFELKPNHLPTVQLKNSPWYSSTQYIKVSKGKKPYA